MPIVVSNFKICLCIISFIAVCAFNIWFFVVPDVKIRKYESDEKRTGIIRKRKTAGYIFLAGTVFCTIVAILGGIGVF